MQTKSKKLLVLLLIVAALALTLVACGKKIDVTFVDQGEETVVSVKVGGSLTKAAPEAKGMQGKDFDGWYDADGNKMPEKAKDAATYTAKYVDGTFTYNDSVSSLATNWNPHVYETNDDSYPKGFIETGFYEFVFKDGSNYKEYDIIPAMAAEKPIDVTTELRSEAKWEIPETAEKGFAYRIKLNPNAKWADGTPINADTYIYSMQQLLNPQLQNYRATDWIDGDLEIKNGKKYLKGGTTSQEDAASYKGLALDKYYFDFSEACYFFGGNSAKLYYDNGYSDMFKNAEGVDLLAKYTGKTVVTEENIKDLLVIAKNFGDNNPEAWYEFCFTDVTWPEESFDNVGIFKSGEYEITLVLEKSLTGFYLLYNLGGNFIVYEPYYEAGKKFDAGVYSNSYNTSVETTMSYGPYSMEYYQLDVSMRFGRNVNWFGYSDERYEGMYQTTNIVCKQIAESSTIKQKFMNGELETYGLQAEDFADYRKSDYAYSTPGDTIFFLILTGHKEGLQAREDATEGVCKSIIADPTFRQAMAVAFNKDDFAATISPARSGAFGIIGTSYIWNVENGETYRNTDAAKEVLCRYYGVEYGEGKAYATLDEAVNAITGYDAALAKELFLKAYNAAIANGTMKETDKIEIEYASSASSSFITKTLAYLNDQLNKVLEGTPLYGKVSFVEGGPYGNEWSNVIRNGQSDTVLGGWTGARLNPYGLTDLYVNPDRAYDANWFNAGKVEMTMTIDGEEITMTLQQWSDCLNGTAVTIGEGDAAKTYNFGYEQVADEVRLQILAEFEYTILGTGSYIPMLQDGGMHLLSKKVNYITEEYHPVLGRGGISYMTYNFTDKQWEEYVKAQGGTLNYK